MQSNLRLVPSLGLAGPKLRGVKAPKRNAHAAIHVNVSEADMCGPAGGGNCIGPGSYMIIIGGSNESGPSNDVYALELGIATDTYR